MKYDIFISYRRDGGEYTAKILHDKLTELGYNVFFDVESLRSGQFNTKLFDVIDECKDFISILSPNSLDRCINEDDWVRLEIAHAMRKEKNVVPVLLRGFQFPEQLPKDIEEIRYRSGIEASTEFFDAFAKRLVEFLQTKPTMFHRITHNTLFKKVLPLVIALFVVLGVSFGGYQFYQTTQASFPYTKADKNLIKELLYYVQSNLTQADLAITQYKNALSSYQTYLDNPTTSNYTNLISTLEYSKKNIQDFKNKYTELDSVLSSKLDTTILEKDDILALKDFLTNFTDGMLNNLDRMTYYLSEESILTITSVSQIVDYYRQILDLEEDLIFYGFNGIFIDVDQDALKDFKSDILPQFSNIYDGQVWLTDLDEIESLSNSNLNKYEGIINDIATIVGNYNVQVDDLENKTDELEDLNSELEALRNSAREKFKPLDTDTPDLLWGKMLRFNSLQMYDMCLVCLTMYQEKATSSEADIFIPIAKAFFNNIEKTKIDYGCLIGGYEPDKPHNSFYQLGDILIEMNGMKIKTYQDIDAAKTDSDLTKVKVLRYNGSEFEMIIGEYPAKDGKVLLYDLSEAAE